MKFKKIPGYVIWIQSSTTTELFPTLVFSADTDMVTMDLVALTSNINNEIVFTELTAEEYKNSNMNWVRRVNMEMNRNDLVEIKFIRRDQKKINKRLFESRVAFMRRSISTATLQTDYYSDINNSTKECLAVKKESIEDFINKGGRLIKL